MNIQGFYGRQEWREKSKHILRRDGYTDQLELRAGRRVPAELVHHILPLDRYPEYGLKDWNLISISKETHRALHTMYGNLSVEGEMLMRETAAKQGIKLSHVYLVCGLPGTGKTTWVKQQLGNNGLVYDLDYIAGAFRLKNAKAEDHKQARKMANSMAVAFAQRVRQYASKGYVIRTAPTIEEAEAIEPDKIVIIDEVKDKRNIPSNQLKIYQERLEELERYALANDIEVLHI